jgi:hypothetical protein
MKRLKILAHAITTSHLFCCVFHLGSWQESAYELFGEFWCSKCEEYRG